MIDTDIDAEVAALARRYRQLGEVIADLAAQRNDIKTRAEALMPVGYSAEIDGAPVYKRPPNREFSLEQAVAVARHEAIPVVTVEVVDQADLKARLKAAGHLDRAMLPGAGANRVQL